MGKQLVKIVKEICKEENIVFHSYSGDYIMQLEANKKSMYIFGNKFPNNNAAAEQICNDKAALSEVLNFYRIPHVPHEYFDSPQLKEYCPSTGIWTRLQSLLQKHSALVCKVNRGTGGNGIYKVTNQRELEAAVIDIFKTSRSMSVSPYLDIKNEYRVVMVNNEMQYVFRKIRPYIIGDGISTVSQLVDRLPNKNKLAITIEIDENDIPKAGEKKELSWKHNLGKGAIPELVLDDCLIKQISNIAIRCASALQLGFVSIDIVESDHGLSVLEINSGVMVESFSAFSDEYYKLSKDAIRKAITHYLHLDLKYYLTRGKSNRFVLPVLYKNAEKQGVDIIEDEEEQNFAIFVFPNGKKFVARDYPFNINDGGSIALCSNKSACNSFMKKLGFNTPKEKYYVRKPNIQITLNEIENDLGNLATALGFSYPLVVKPNNLAQGEGVFIVRNREECLHAAQEAFTKSKIVLLQEYCQGNEYRIVVLNGQILQAYQRKAFYIKGDGLHTIKALIDRKIESFKVYGRDKEVNPSDPRVLAHIKQAGYTTETVLPENEILRLQDIANLSLGGESIDVINIVDNRFKTMAIELAASFNLRLCGIDIIADDITNYEKKYTVLEINSSPGLDNYLYEKNEQEKYVESLYGEILHTLGGI